MLRKSPGFTVVAAAMLALGIGTATVTFSLVNAVLLRPFPAVRPQQLVALNEINPSRGFSAGDSISYANFIDWRRDNRTLTGAALYRGAGYALEGDGAIAEHVDAGEVTAGYFEVFGVAPILGRTFTAEEESPHGPRAVVLSADLWQRRFGRDRSVVGRVLRLDGETYTIVGVMPADFRFPDRSALWTPVRLEATDELRGTRSYEGVARLNPGVSIRQASTDLNAIAARLAKSFPAPDAGYGVRVRPFIAQIAADYQRSALTLFGAVACVLLITCVNVATLLLARGVAREREIAVRLALGASRGNVVRQLLGESLVLGFLGGALGVLLAVWGLPVFRALLPVDVPEWIECTLDGTVLAFAVGISVLASLAFGLAPAWQLARVDLNETLKKGGRSGVATRTGLMAGLIAAELSLALVLLVGAGLLMKSFLRLQHVNPGFDPHGVLEFRLTLPEATYPDDARQREAGQRIVERLQALPGVESAALVSDLPLANSSWGRSFTVEGRPDVDPSRVPVALNRVVSSDYFHALRIPLRAGRTFDAHDTPAGRPVVLIDETMARQFFRGENPIGRRIHYGSSRTGTRNPWMEIVGVVGDVRHYDLQNTFMGPGLYVPVTQQPPSYGAFYLVRLLSGAPPLTEAQLRAAVAAYDPALAPEAMYTMDALVHRASWRSRLLGGIFATFAGIALLLSALGVYGVTAFATGQRTREIGVRIALGAGPAHVRHLILAGGMRLAAIALLLGGTAAFLLARLLASQLYAVEPHDPTIFAGVAALLAAVTLLACLIPARRATRVDPVVALRSE